MCISGAHGAFQAFTLNRLVFLLLWDEGEGRFQQEVSDTQWLTLSYLSLGYFQAHFLRSVSEQVKEGDENGKAGMPSGRIPPCDFLGHGSNLTAKWKAV